MLNRRCKITCSIRASVTLGDLSVTLQGYGSSKVVLLSSANRSADLRRAKSNGWVKVTPVAPVGFWPLVPRAAGVVREPAPAPVSEVPSEAAPTLRTGQPPDAAQATLKLLQSIDGKLGELLSRPSPATPEVVAAAVKGIGAHRGIPDGLPGGARIPGPGVSSHPQFIPSRIVPQEGVEARVKTSEHEVEHDVEKGVEALKRLRRNKT